VWTSIRNVDFSKYKTYAFTEGTPTPVTLTNQRIEKAIEAQLAARGLTRLESNADLTVVFHLLPSLNEPGFSTRSLDGWGWGPGWGWGRGWKTLGRRREQRSLKWSKFLLGLSSSISATHLPRDTFGAGLPLRRSAANLTRTAKAIDDVMKKMFEKFSNRRERGRAALHTSEVALRAGPSVPEGPKAYTRKRLADLLR